MRLHTNGWIHEDEFMRAAAAIHKAATTIHFHWLDFPNVKYIQLRIDQRTGSFCFQDQNGERLPMSTVYGLFPELVSD